MILIRIHRMILIHQSAFSIQKRIKFWVSSSVGIFSMETKDILCCYLQQPVVCRINVWMPCCSNNFSSKATPQLLLPFPFLTKKKDNTYNIGTEWPQMVAKSYNKATISIWLVGMTCVATISMTCSFFHSQGG